MKTYKRAFLFANGSVVDLTAISRQIRKTDLLVAVDGGLKYLANIKLTPSILIGDLDSVSTKDVQRLEKLKVEIRKFPVSKDETDLELALGMLSEFKVSKVTVAGATSDRLDHSLGNIHLLTKFQSTFDLSLDDGRQEIFLIGDRTVIHGKPDDLVSLIPLQEIVTGVTTTHLAYPLRNEILYFASTRGISNVFLGNTAIVQKQKGTLLCIHNRS
jgi:thiamine pyrophosphokinase